MKILNMAKLAIIKKAAGALAPVISSSIGLNFGMIRDWYAGAWQQGKPPYMMGRPALSPRDAFDNAAVYSCISRLAGDFSMLQPRTQKKRGGIWQDETPNNSFLTIPNQFETPSQFWEHWIISLLTFGNAFIYTRRDAWFILNPQKVRIMVAIDGSGRIYYECGEDLQCGITESILLGPEDIIHGRINAHIGINPVLGVPPVYAAALAAQLGVDAKHAAEQIYNNAARPGGVIQVPGSVDNSKLREIKAAWETGYGSENRGKTAVLSDDMKFIPYESANLVDAELIAALKLSAEQVAAIFGIPGYKIGAGSYPAYAGQSQADQAYLNGTIQRYINLTEELLARRIAGINQRVHFDTSPLLRLDREKHVAVLASAVAGCLMAPNEARAELNLPPVTGGEYPLSQQQYFSLPALAVRDTSGDPFGTSSAPAPEAANDPAPADSKDARAARLIKALADLPGGGNPFITKSAPNYSPNAFNYAFRDGYGQSMYLSDGPSAADYSGRVAYLDGGYFGHLKGNASQLGDVASVLLLDNRNHPIGQPLVIGNNVFIKREGTTGANKRKIRVWFHNGYTEHWEQHGDKFAYVA